MTTFRNRLTHSSRRERLPCLQHVAGRLPAISPKDLDGELNPVSAVVVALIVLVLEVDWSCSVVVESGTECSGSENAAT